MEDGANPVTKIPLGVTGVDAELIFVELMQEESAAGNGKVAGDSAASVPSSAPAPRNEGYAFRE